jgi:predicted Zn-dependent protease
MECRPVKPIRVGYRHYQVRDWTQADQAITEAHGMCDKLRGVIYVCTDAEPLVVVDTLIHEILHAIWHEYGLGDSEAEERCVLVLASGLTQVLADNPHLRVWINKQTRRSCTE